MIAAAGKYSRTRRGSRVSSGIPAATACAPIKKSGSGADLFPPRRRYSTKARAASQQAAHGTLTRTMPTPCRVRSSRSRLAKPPAISA